MSVYLSGCVDPTFVIHPIKVMNEKPFFFFFCCCCCFNAFWWHSIFPPPHILVASTLDIPRILNLLLAFIFLSLSLCVSVLCVRVCVYSLAIVKHAAAADVLSVTHFSHFDLCKITA